MGSYARTRDGGSCCFTPEAVSTIDYFIVSYMFRAHHVECSAIDSGLATHKPVLLRWDMNTNLNNHVNWIEKHPKQ